MRVLFVGSHRSDKQFSIVGFENVLQRVLSPRLDFKVVYPQVSLPGSSQWKWARYVEKYFLFPKVLRSEAKNYDLIHFCEKGAGLNIRHVMNKRTLVTTHDYLAIRAAFDQFPGWSVSPSGRIYQKMILKSVQKATALACVSEATRFDQKTFLPEFPGLVKTILNSTYKEYRRMESLQAKQLLDKIVPIGDVPFFLHVGGNKPYKNRKGVLEIFARTLELDPLLPWCLVMAGGAKSLELAHKEAELKIGSRVLWVTEPSDTQIEALYSLAGALIFPSFTEGFGLPVLEAQACGCPVFTSNRGPLSEVGGNAAIYFEPSDIEEAATQILANIDNLEHLSQLGYENVKRFDPQTMGDAYFDFYSEIMAQSR